MKKMAVIVLFSLALGLVCQGGESASIAREALGEMRRNRFAEAGALYEKAASREEDGEVRWRYLQDAMNAYGRSAPDKRIACAEKLLAEEKDLSTGRRANLLGHIVRACCNRGDYSGHYGVAFEWFRTTRAALEEEKLPEKKADLLLSLLEIDERYSMNGLDRYETAMEAASIPGLSPRLRMKCLKAALRGCKRVDDNDPAGIGAKRAREIDCEIAKVEEEMAAAEKRPVPKMRHYLAAADSLLAHGDHGSAITALGKALAVADLPVDEQARVLARIAAVQLQAKDPAAAGKSLDRALALPGLSGPARRETLWKLFRGHEDAKEWEAAEKVLGRLRSDPEATDRLRYDVEIARARLLRAQGRAEAADEVARQAWGQAGKSLAGRERFEVLMAQAEELQKGATGANARAGREAAIEKATEAIGTEGTFDKRRGYDFIARLYGSLAAWHAESAEEAADLFDKSIAITERIWTDREKMGLSSNVAARCFYDISSRIIRHSGRPARDPARARLYHEKALAHGAGPGGNLPFIENVERLEEAFRSFPDRGWRKTVEPFFDDLDKRLSKGKVVHAKDFGWTKEDATKALQGALDSDASVVIVDDMGSPWYVETILMRSNKKIIFRKGVEIVAKRYAFRPRNSHLFHFYNVGNILIEGEGREPVKCRMWKRDYLENRDLYPAWTDTRDCMRIAGGQNIRIRNCEFSSSGGDGVITTFAFGEINTKRLWLDRCVFDDNIRQGYSICDGSTYIYLTDCAFNRSWGGEPMSGIDVEPWCEAFECHDIYVEGCRFLGNRIDGIVIMNSTYRPFSFFAKDCFFEGNRHACVNIQMRGGVPTVNKMIFEDCEFRQQPDKMAIRIGRTFTGNATFRDCRIVESPGLSSAGLASPIEFQTTQNRQDLYAPGKTVFENLSIEGYRQAPAIALDDKSGTTMLKGIVEGELTVNGKRRSVADILAEEGYDKRPNIEWKAPVCDLDRLDPPSSDTAIDAFVPAPHGGGYSILFYREKGQLFSVGIYSRITYWINEMSSRIARLRRPGGLVEELGPLDNKTDNTHFTCRAEETGFHEVISPDWGFYAPSDDKIWRYSYRATSRDGFVNCSYNGFTGVFEVPADAKTVTMQAYAFQSFRLYDASGKIVGEAHDVPGLRTFQVKRKRTREPEIWYFSIDHGFFRFFAPMNGIFADCIENLPRMRR